MYPLYWRSPQKPGTSYSTLQKISINSIFHRSIKIQLTPSYLLPICFQQVLNSAQLAVLRALFEPAKMVFNQVPNGRMVRVSFLLRNDESFKKITYLFYHPGHCTSTTPFWYARFVNKKIDESSVHHSVGLIIPSLVINMFINIGTLNPFTHQENMKLLN